jgi:F0F1-type ATP synthase membrane subunit c/vacuolar-type H+-ATPase subunit K
MSEPDQAAAATGGRPKASARALAQVIERSSRVQGPAAEAYVSRLRHTHPGASPAEIVAKLEKRYVSVVTASGVAVGAAATIPGIGTLSALSAAAAETVAFLEATALFVLALAVVYGIPADHRERRRALVLAVLAGDNSRHAIAELVGPGRTNGAWISESVATLPLSSMSRLNQRLLKSWVKRYTVRRGALLFGKMLPVGIGALVGAIGNYLAGKKIVRNARRAYGAPPARWPSPLRLLPPIHEAG